MWALDSLGEFRGLGVEGLGLVSWAWLWVSGSTVAHHAKLNMKP